MVEHEIAHDILRQLKAARHVLIVPHGNPRPDGDCLGAALAIHHFLADNSRVATIFCAYPAPEMLQYLPGVEHIITDPAVAAALDYDLILLVDFHNLKNSGLTDQLQTAITRGVPVVTIDHHPRQVETTGLTLLLPEAAATCELIYWLFDQTATPITKDMATCLLTGLITDTQNFTNAATTVGSLHAAAELVKRGARPHDIIGSTWKNKEIKILQLWGKMLLRLHENPETGIVITALTLADLQEAGVPLDAADGVANFLNNLDAKAVMVLREEESGKVKGSIRTTRDDVDVSAIAKEYGGGGHHKAAGFLTTGHITWDDTLGWLIK